MRNPVLAGCLTGFIVTDWAFGLVVGAIVGIGVWAMTDRRTWA